MTTDSTTIITTAAATYGSGTTRYSGRPIDAATMARFEAPTYDAAQPFPRLPSGPFSVGIWYGERSGIETQARVDGWEAWKIACWLVAAGRRGVCVRLNGDGNPFAFFPE